jgi:hypothetical protein
MIWFGLEQEIGIITDKITNQAVTGLSHTGLAHAAETSVDGLS